jgi:hypothetical protein
MPSPFHIEGPAVISFSGGRTSAYMLRRVLDEGLQPGVHVVFADTGREREETYSFVATCMARWGVPIHRIQGRPGADPFRTLIQERRFLPFPKARFCTSDLKVLPIAAFMRARGYEHWTNVVGLRADEPARVAKLRNDPKPPPVGSRLPALRGGDLEVGRALLLGYPALRSPSARVGGELRSLLSQGRSEAPPHHAGHARSRGEVD